MQCCWLGRKLMLIFFRAGEFSCWFSLRLQISTQRLFATHSNDVAVWIRPLECSRKFSVRLCAACMLKWPFKSWRVQVKRLSESHRIACSQVSSVYPIFPNFSQFPPDFAGPRATADRRCALRIDAQRRLWILNWRRFKPSGNLAAINFRLPKATRQVALVPVYNWGYELENPDFSEFS